MVYLVSILKERLLTNTRSQVMVSCCWNGKRHEGRKKEQRVVEATKIYLYVALRRRLKLLLFFSLLRFPLVFFGGDVLFLKIEMDDSVSNFIWFKREIIPIE